MMKYIVVLVVVLCAAHLLLFRTRQSGRETAARKSIRRGLESTVRKLSIAVGVLIAALAIILLVKHVTAG